MTDQPAPPAEETDGMLPARACSLPPLHAESITINPTDPEVLDILSILSFTAGPYAGHLRKCGYEIKRKIEVEQATVILWWLTLYQKHGKDWREKGAQELRELLSAANADVLAPAGDKTPTKPQDD